MVNGSGFDNPAALSGVLTGVSFVGGWPLDSASPTRHFRSRARTSKTCRILPRGRRSRTYQRNGPAPLGRVAGRVFEIGRAANRPHGRRIQDAQSRCHRRWGARQHLAGRLRDRACRAAIPRQPSSAEPQFARPLRHTNRQRHYRPMGARLSQKGNGNRNSAASSLLGRSREDDLLHDHKAALQVVGQSTGVVEVVRMQPHAAPALRRWSRRGRPPS
jgi:hypothetical protein